MKLFNQMLPVITAAAGLTACSGGAVMVARNRPLPPPGVVYQGVAPRAGMVWIRGHWR